MLYFDHNATTPLLPAARQAWIDAAEQFVGNPSSPHRLGARAEAALQTARERLASILGCAPFDLVWTSGATESANMVLHHAARRAPADTEAWLSAVEHPCALAAAARYFPKRHRFIPVDHAGRVEIDWVRKEIARSRPALVVVMAANNETGVLQPWPELLALCRGWNVPFFCDAAQWIGKRAARGLGACDFVSGCAHKFGGPRGVGFVKVPSAGSCEPLLVGGPQEEGRRAGTENVAGVLSMLAALTARESLLATGAEQARLAWRENVERQLLLDLPGAQILGAGAERLWNTVSAQMPEVPGVACQPRWVVKLDKLGFAVSTGSACSSGQEKPSHVLAAMGLTPASASRVLRLSAGWETTERDWAALLEGLRQIHAQLIPITS